MSARPPRLWPWILIPIAGLVAVAALVLAGYLLYGAGGPVPWPWWGFFPWFPFVGIGIVLGFLFLFGALRCSAGPWGWGGGWGRWAGDDSGAILRERYARGEITRDQFDRMRRDLDEHVALADTDDRRPGS